MLGGKDHYPADREAAQSILVDFPEVEHVARANRRFVTRAVRYVAAQGITQYLDIGAGLPTAPAVHETAQQADPAARVAYVDNDSLVITYARALLAGGPGVTVVPGDMRNPAAILANPDLRLLIDLEQPVCLLLASVLHFLLPAEADATVAGSAPPWPPAVTSSPRRAPPLARTPRSSTGYAAPTPAPATSPAAPPRKSPTGSAG
ncbi:MAG TPA: SAM-dependent methyltransferase [Streptosporangiaceae bacterium]|nr:SAM-dependent methyltransferase [Streptosporangiaceae bacterium]